LALVVVLSLGGVRAGAEVSGPALETDEATLRVALSCPETFSNTQHEPVLLVHGTFANSEINWSWSYKPSLRAAGYDVCTVDLPNNGLDDIQVATEYVVFAVRHIAELSGRPVDVLGVSQGGLEPRWAIKWWPDVQASIDDLVMLATPNHGTYGQPPSGIRCFASCWQMGSGSRFVSALNSGDESPGAVSYTSIYTMFDELVQPNTTSMVDGASNILIQDLCALRPVDHSLISGDAVSYALALDAFSNPGPADPARFDPAACMQAATPAADGAAGITAVTNELLAGPPQFTSAAEEPPLKPYAQ
jgi:pimeloyl-ACP methyl ester carboxylesterase